MPAPEVRGADGNRLRRELTEADAVQSAAAELRHQDLLAGPGAESLLPPGRGEDAGG